MEKKNTKQIAISFKVSKPFSLRKPHSKSLRNMKVIFQATFKVRRDQLKDLLMEMQKY